jgi:hypothetical protein
MPKKFGLAASDIKQLAPGHSACLATDHITVDMRPVRFMYRELPDNDVDSGWRFFSGEETQEYVDDPANLGMYNVNTIANYDPDIIPHLDAPVFSAFERSAETGQFLSVPFPG